jgi:hypothetical protein
VRNAENRANSGAKSFVGVSGSKFGQKMQNANHQATADLQSPGVFTRSARILQKTWAIDIATVSWCIIAVQN